MFRTLVLALALFAAVPSFAQESDPWEREKIRLVIGAVTTQGSLYARAHNRTTEPAEALSAGARADLEGILALLAAKGVIWAYRVDMAPVNNDVFEAKIWFTFARDSEGTAVSARFTFTRPQPEKQPDA